MKTIALFIFLAIYSHELQAQKYYTKTAEIAFNGTTSGFEPVEAVSKSGTIILDIESQKIAALVLIKSLKFPIALMQEHFNENYVESDLYPKATFKGDVSLDGFKLNTANVFKTSIKGEFEIHGVKQHITVPITLEYKDGKIKLASSFILLPEKFNIKVPSIVSQKIADKIKVEVKATLEKK